MISLQSMVTFAKASPEHVNSQNLNGGCLTKPHMTDGKNSNRSQPRSAMLRACETSNSTSAKIPLWTSFQHHAASFDSCLLDIARHPKHHESYQMVFFDVSQLANIMLHKCVAKLGVCTERAICNLMTLHFGGALSTAYRVVYSVSEPHFGCHLCFFHLMIIRLPHWGVGAANR